MIKEPLLDALAGYRERRAGDYGIVRLGVFGSSARHAEGQTSDVDIVVELAKPDLLILVGIKQELEDLFDRQVDVVRYRDNMNHFLKQRIDRDVVYV